MWTRKKPDGIRNQRVSKRTNPNKIITHRSSRGVIYVGIDVHKTSFRVAAINKDGAELLNEKIKMDHPLSGSLHFLSPQQCKD